jgi:hypothetical protein
VHSVKEPVHQKTGAVLDGAGEQSPFVCSFPMRNAQSRELAVAEGRLLSVRNEILDRAWQLGKLLPAIKDRVGHGKWMIWLPDGNFGRRARLRIAKSSISKRSFSFKKTIDLREETAIFHDQRRVHDRRIKTSSF